MNLKVKMKSSSAHIAGANQLRLLICGDYSSDKNNQMLCMIEKVLANHNQYSIVVKPHPNCQIDLIHSIFPMLKSLIIL